MLEGLGETLDCFDIAIRELSDKTIQAKPIPILVCMVVTFSSLKSSSAYDNSWKLDIL